jgi:hypothetical protein
MKRSEILMRDKELFNQDVEKYIANCESIKNRVNNINKNEIGESEDTLLTNSIYASNNRLGTKLENTIKKVMAERESLNAKIDQEIQIALEQERQELLKLKEKEETEV